MRLHRNTIWLIPLLCIITFPLWSPPIGRFLTPRGGFDPDINKKPTATHNFSMQTVKILQNQDGRRAALIRAEQAHTSVNDDEVLIMKRVDADIFDENEDITRIVAREGQYSLATEILTLAGDVVVNKIKENQFLFTDLLYYNSQERTIHCPGETRLKSDGAEIHGGSFDYDITTGQYVIGNRVKTLIQGFSAP